MKKSQKNELSLSMEESYEMNFMNDENNQKNKNQTPKMNDKNGKKDKGYIQVVLFALAFIVVLALMLYFFVFRNSSNSVSYTDSDLIYNVDNDHDGKADVDSNGYPVFEEIKAGTFKVGDTTNQNYVVMKGGSDGSVNSIGTLAEILINAEDNKTILDVKKSYYFDSTYYLSGSYVRKENSKDITYTFKATISDSYYNHYLLPIIKNVSFKDSTSGNFYIYYSSTTLLNTRHVYTSSVEQINSTSSWLMPLIIAIISFVLIGWFINKMYKSVGGSGPGAMTGFVDNLGRKTVNSKVRFSDVAGCDEAKAELVEMVDYFHATDRYTRLGAKLPHGVLLVGPPGTGKTLLAKAVAGEANVPFYSISGSDFVEMYVGVGASRVRNLFKTAKQNAPCLIFIDEIDAVGRQRGAGLGGGNDEREQTLNELLVEMDGFEDNSGIIVMAATNRSDVLDPALTRPGRFDRNITVDLPDRAGRAAILKVHSRNKKLASDVSFDSIASRTVGFSGADLANIMNEAAILAVRSNRTVITTADIDEAIDRAIAGPAKKTHLEENEKKQVAFHEAGHAVIGIFLPYSDVVQKITIIPRGRTGGHVLMTPAQDHFLLTKNQLLARITGYLGGRTSEEIFFGDVSTGASNDIEVATQIARSMVTQYGMSELGLIQYEKPGGSVFLGRDYNSTQANYSTQIAFEIDKAVRQIVDECHEKARDLLTEHKEDVELIANTLIKNETITADQIEYLLKNRELPKEDEHIMANENGETPLNKNNIILYPGYEKYYSMIDKILVNNPTRIVLVAPGKIEISSAEFKEACRKGAKDPSKIGVIFIDSEAAKDISLSLPSFATHLESYANVPFLLILATESCIKKLEFEYQSVKTVEENKTNEVVENKDAKDLGNKGGNEDGQC